MPQKFIFCYHNLYGLTMIQNVKMIYSIIALSKFYEKDVPKCYTYLGDFSIPFEQFLFSAEIAL